MSDTPTPALVPSASVPPASVPSASVPSASVPPASVPPVSVPPASVPPASVPPASVISLALALNPEEVLEQYLATKKFFQIFKGLQSLPEASALKLASLLGFDDYVLVKEEVSDDDLATTKEMAVSTEDLPKESSTIVNSEDGQFPEKESTIMKDVIQKHLKNNGKLLSFTGINQNLLEEIFINDFNPDFEYTDDTCLKACLEGYRQQIKALKKLQAINFLNCYYPADRLKFLQNLQDVPGIIMKTSLSKIENLRANRLSIVAHLDKDQLMVEDTSYLLNIMNSHQAQFNTLLMNVKSDVDKFTQKKEQVMKINDALLAEEEYDAVMEKCTDEIQGKVEALFTEKDVNKAREVHAKIMEFFKTLG